MGPKTMGQDKMLVIIDYGMGNVRSVAKAFEILGVNVLISNNADDIKKAERIIMPGVGAFSDGIERLKKLNLINALKDEILIKKKPFLGICLGMQLIAKQSEEFGIHKGLGWVDAEIKEFKFNDKRLKVPHVGWNNINIKKEGDLFNGIKDGTEYYFVHSYFMSCKEDIVTATCNYGIEFVSAIQKDNIFATQFHPEKSQTVGLKLLENFINWENK